jgi:hypothetical protein
MTCLKNLGTFAFPGLWPLCNFCGAVAIPATLSKFPLQLSSEAGALFQRKGSTLNLVPFAPRWAPLYPVPARQLTKRRIRTFITIPSAINMNNKDEPP